MGQYIIDLSPEERKALLAILPVPKFLNDALLGRFAVDLANEEEKALLTNMLVIQDWLGNAIHNKARQCMDKVVEDYSDKQPKKISEMEKYQIIRDAKVKTIVEKNAEFEAI